MRLRCWRCGCYVQVDAEFPSVINTLTTVRPCKRCLREAGKVRLPALQRAYAVGMLASGELIRTLKARQEVDE